MEQHCTCAQTPISINDSPRAGYGRLGFYLDLEVLHGMGVDLMLRSAVFPLLIQTDCTMLG